jgi:glutaminyl-tRNA synthetase
VEEKGYRRLTKGQAVGLRYAGLVISLKNVKKDASGQVVELDVMCTTSANCTEKPKAFIHWVSNPMFVEVRLYERL